MEQQYDLQTIAVWLEQIGALAPLERTVNVTDNDDQSKVSPVETLQQRLQDGIALCKLLNHIRPDTIININLITDQHDFAAHDNLNSFISGCEYYLGIEQNQLFEVGDVKSNDPEKWMKVIKVILALEAVASANGKTPRLKDITIADGKYDSRVPSLKETLDSNRTIALYSYEKTKQDELSFEEGEIILIVSRVEGGWWEGQKLSTGEIGWFPSNYVQDAPDVAPVPSPRNSKDKMPQEDSMARTIFLRDFLRSEMNFYESLHSFVENVVEFLALEENMIVFPSTDHMIAFGRIYDILSFHMRFIGEFEKCLKEKYQNQLIGKLFSDFVESFTDVFSAYCTQYSKAVRVISKYKSDEKFASCLRKAYDNPSAMKAGLFFTNPPIINIMSWLVKPTQRLPKYVKFLQDLIKITSASHPDAAILPGAEVEFNHAFQKIMSIKKLSENREILGDISGRIDGWEGPALEHYGELIMDGSLRIIKGDHKSKERYFFLLDKILVCLQKNAPKPNSARQDFVHYKLVEVIPMNNAAVNLRTLPDNNSAKNVFQINFNEDSRQKSLVLSAVSPELKQKWLHALQRTLENNAHYSFPAIPQDLSSEIKSLPQETLKSLPSSLKRFLSTRVKGKSYKKVVQRSNESIFDAKKDPVPDVPKKAGLHNILATFLPSADRPSSSASKISSTKNSEDSESKNAGVDAKPKRSLSLLSRSNSLRQAFKGFGSNNANTEKDKSKELIKTASGTSVTRGIQNGLQRALTVSATSSKYKDLASKYKRKTPMPTNDKNFIAKVQEAANEHYASETSRPTSPEFLQSPISNVPELEPAKDVLSPVVNVPESVEDKSVLSLQPVPSRITFIDKPKELVESDAKVVTSGSYRLHVESVDESTSSNTYPVVSMISTVPKSRAESTNIARSASTTTLMEQTTTNYGPSLSNLISKLEKNLEEFSIDLDLTKELSNRQLQTLLMFSLQKHFEALERIEKLEQKNLVRDMDTSHTSESKPNSIINVMHTTRSSQSAMSLNAEKTGPSGSHKNLTAIIKSALDAVPENQMVSSPSRHDEHNAEQDPRKLSSGSSGVDPFTKFAASQEAYWTFTFKDPGVELQYSKFFAKKIYNGFVIIILAFTLCLLIGYIVLMAVASNTSPIWVQNRNSMSVNPSDMALDARNKCPSGYYCSECTAEYFCGYYNLGPDIGILLASILPGISVLIASKYVSKITITTYYHTICCVLIYFWVGIGLIIRGFALQPLQNPSITAISMITATFSAYLGLQMRFLQGGVLFLALLLTWVIGYAAAAKSPLTAYVYEFAICTFAFVGSGLFVLYSLYINEKFYREQFLRGTFSSKVNSKLINQLKSLQKTYTSGAVDTESPLEKSVAIIRSMIADSSLSTTHGQSLELVARLLNSPQLFTPDFEHQLSVHTSDSEGLSYSMNHPQAATTTGTIDNDQKTWLLTEITKRKSELKRVHSLASAKKRRKSIMGGGASPSDRGDTPEMPTLPKSMSKKSFYGRQNSQGLYINRNNSSSIDADIIEELEISVVVHNRDPFNYALHRAANADSGEKTIRILRDNYLTNIMEIQRPLRSKNSTAYNYNTLQNLLANLNVWNFNLFEFAECCPGGKPLFIMMWHLFETNGLFEEFNIPVEKFNNFVWTIQEGYRELPYHNATHAADVLHAVNYFAEREEISNVLAPLELAALYFASAIHDFDHPGLNNNFLITTKNPLALFYNDRAVLESYHTASAFQILLKPDNHFLSALPHSDWQAFREIVIDMVLATDLSQHYSTLTQFKTRLQTGFNSEIKEDRSLLLKMLIKCADVSNPTKEFSIYNKWTTAVLEEWRAQGDAEKKLNIPVSPFMDRDNPNVLLSSQTGFIDFIIVPMYEAIHTGIMSIPEPMDELEKNRAHWMKLKEEQSNKEQLPGQERVTLTKTKKP